MNNPLKMLYALRFSGRRCHWSPVLPKPVTTFGEQRHILERTVGELIYICFISHCRSEFSLRDNGQSEPNIISRKTLVEYCKKYPGAAVALQEWYHELVRCDYKNFNELKRVYENASLV